MKRNFVCPCSGILYFLLSISALTQTSSVSGGNRDVQGNIDAHDTNIKVVDKKLKAAEDIMRAQPPDYDRAIATLAEAVQMAPDQDAVWYRLGVAYLRSANAQDDAVEKTKRSTEAYNDLEKAIDLVKQRKSQQLKEGFTPPCNIKGECIHVEPVKGTVSDHHKLGVYYSNFGDAAAKLGKKDEAIKDFQQAAQLDPAYAGTYYFDEGIILRNEAKSVEERKDAVEAFDKSAAADPTKAASYYLKGELLFGMATTDSEGKIVLLPGTVEALKKYLELQPNGRYAEQAKSMMAALNVTTQNSDGTTKGTNKKN